MIVCAGSCGATERRAGAPRHKHKNDDNSKYTMADAVFTACFLNVLNRNSDIVGMANYAPIVNTRGCIYTYPEGIVLRSTYFVFDLYVNYMGDIVYDSWNEDTEKMTVENKRGESVSIDSVDVLVTSFSDGKGLALAAINKEAIKKRNITLSFSYEGSHTRMYSISGGSTETYNDIGQQGIQIEEKDLGSFFTGMEISLEPHSVNIIQIDKNREVSK